jgi:hypothetical protein
MDGIALSYPLWFILLCAALGVAYAAVLYFRDRTFSESGPMSRKWLPVLSVVRFLSVTVIALLLLSPFIRSRNLERIQPVVLVLHDRSASVASGMTASDSAMLEEGLESFRERLAGKFEVDAYSFDAELHEGAGSGYSGKQTDISAAFSGLYDRYVNRNIGAIVLATDGIFNKGNNPLYARQGLDAPVYTIALGDTTPRKDLRIAGLLHNSLAYLGDKVELRIEVDARFADGESTSLRIDHIVAGRPNRTVFEQSIAIDNPDFQTEVRALLDMNTTGVQQYLVSLRPVANEVSTANNSERIFIDVLDGRQQVLILATSPHPDLAAIRSALEGTRNYEVTIQMAAEYTPGSKPFDLVVLHQLPSANYPFTDEIKRLQDQGTPLWFILGDQSNMRLLNSVQQVIQVQAGASGINDVQAVLMQRFGLFTLPGNAIAIQNYPPIQVPFGNYSAANDALVLFTQRIGAVATEYPLFAFRQTQTGRTAVLAGTGLWRWRLHNFRTAEDHALVDEFIRKTVQYLSVKADKRRFRVTMPSKVVDENMPVLFDAELYNEAFEPVNTPDVAITIRNEEGNEFPFTFTRTTTAYRLDAGFFPTGSYTWNASTLFNRQELSASGQFSVRSVNLEDRQLQADHGLLYRLAAQTGGQMYFPAQLDALADSITSRGDIRPVLQESYRTSAIIDFKWLFTLICFLLALEWFVRKFNGAY